MKSRFHAMITIAAVGLLALFAGGLGGCTGTQAQNTLLIDQGVKADDAGVKSATSLYTAGTITASAASGVLTGAKTAEAALKTADADNVAGSPNFTTDAAAFDAALTTLAQLLSTSTTPQPANMALAARLLHSPTAAQLRGRKVGTDLTGWIQLIDLAATLSPVLITEINNLFNQTAATEAQLQADFATLDADLATLQAALAAPAPAPPATAHRLSLEIGPRP